MHVERTFVICLHFFLAVYGFRTNSTCIKDLTKVFTVKLQCPDGEWIRVEHEVYGNGDSGTCRLNSVESCSKKLDSSQQGLVVNCNGKQSCLEAMQVQPIDNCNVTKAVAEVQYNCIKGSMNMCSSVTTTVNGSVYLYSPGFSDSVGVNSSCVVRITGQTLQVTLLEGRMRSGMLNISGDGRQLWTNVNVNQYNRVLPGQAAEIVIVYENRDQNGSNLWIRVADSGQMYIKVNREIMDASSTTTSRPQLPRLQSTSDPSTSDTTTTETRTRAHSTTTVAASLTNATSSRGHTSHSTGNIATHWSPKSTTMVSTTVSTTDTIITTNMTTKDGEASSTTTSNLEPGLIVWVGSAVSGCVVTILIVVIAVVLCRKHVKKNRFLETPGKTHFEKPSELSSMNAEKHHNCFGQNETCNQYFVLDPELAAGSGQPFNTEPGHRTETYDMNAIALPLASTVNMYDKSTFTVTDSEAGNGAPHVIKSPNGRTGICGMTENDLYEGGFDYLREGMVDNVVYDKFNFKREKESVQNDSDTSPNNSEQVWKNNCEMIENDVYDGGLPHAANENNVDDLYDGRLETNEGMVDNGLYDKFEYDREKESLQDESHTSPSNSKQAWKGDCEMIENNVYDGGHPQFEDPLGSMADNDKHVGDLYDGGLETKFEYDREKESPQEESDTFANNSK